MKLRNKVAHAKPELVEEEAIWTRAEYDQLRTEPKAKLEKQITLKNAQRALKSVEAIKDMLCSSIDPEDAFGLFSDAWSGSAAPIADD